MYKRIGLGCIKQDRLSVLEYVRLTDERQGLVPTPGAFQKLPQLPLPVQGAPHMSEGPSYPVCVFHRRQRQKAFSMTDRLDEMY